MDEREEIESTENIESATPAQDGFSQFFGSAKDAIHRYQHCMVCGANLHFSYVTDFNRNLAEESAKCPECGVRARRVLHRLQ